MPDISVEVSQSALDPNKVRFGYMRKGSFATGGDDYRTGGISLDAIGEDLDWVFAVGGVYMWVFDPATNKLKAMKAVDEIDTAGDGTMVEEDDQTAITATIYYFAVKFPDNQAEGDKDIMYLKDF